MSTQMTKKMVDLFSELQKMDPSISQALARIRSGKGTREDANLLARGMYTDTLVPSMGNKAAYNDFLTRHGNDGYHVHADMNDFGEINKIHGEKAGDQGIKRFGSLASEVSRRFGGKSFRNGGDEFKFHFNRPEAAHGFARELRSRLEKEPKIAGTHNMAASIGIGFNPDHAEKALMNAKSTLGTKPPNGGRRVNFHTSGNAPTVLHSLTHEQAPMNWKAGKGKPVPPPAPATKPLNTPGLQFHNPLAKAATSEALINRPIPSPDHPALNGGRVGVMTAENPFFPVITPGENDALEQELRAKGLKYEPVRGKYSEGPYENSFVIHDVSPQEMADLGKRYGQESVLHSHQGKHRMIYTNGDKEGMFHTGEGHTLFEQEPDMYYSTLNHNGHPVYFSYNVDFDKLYGPDAPEQETLSHPNSYPWHDDGDEEELGKAESMPHPHNDAGQTKSPANGGTVNTQAAGVGVKTYGHFAAPYGEVKPGVKSNLFHYDYRPVKQKVFDLVKQHGFNHYIAGGKYEKPDLKNRNYNTKHLMIYDPDPDAGATFGDRDYTYTWRLTHELSHGLTYPALNAKYGEGRRIGKLGVHRTPREAKRAVEWEWMAAHKQRELTEQLLGHKIPDELFHRELNTVMHDAVHRAVTGQFTEPSDEGFHPHSHKVPLETALGMVDSEAQRMGIPDDNSLAPKKTLR